MRFAYLLFLILLISPFLIYFTKQPENKNMEKFENSENSILILYDNEKIGDLKSDWGFSCLINFENRSILFDTGGNSQILFHNLEKLNVDFKRIDSVFLSHIHADHTGALLDFLKKNSNVTVYLPASFPLNFKNEIKTYARVVEISNSTQILPKVYSTGELGDFIREQSLILKTEKGLVVITGCAHPGITNILRKVKDQFNQKIYLVVGGFHLFSSPQSRIQSIVEEFKKLGVERVAPCHCSGDLAKEVFKKAYGENFIECAAGKLIPI